MSSELEQKKMKQKKDETQKGEEGEEEQGISSGWWKEPDWIAAVCQHQPKRSAELQRLGWCCKAKPQSSETLLQCRKQKCNG